MRKKERIDPFLQKFGELWKEYPDLRFGQLFQNVAHLSNIDPFYLEEWQFEDLIKEFREKYPNGRL